MVNNQITKEKIKKLMEIPGKAKGVVLKTDAEYIRQKKGKEGLTKVKEELKKIGCPINYEDIKATSWYPIGLRAISLLVIKKVFNWGNKEIENMGNEAPKYSFIVKSLLRYFLNFPRTYKEAPKYWEKHYMVGKLEAPDFDLKKKYYIIRLKDFKIHPILCVYLSGYFVRMGQLVLKGNNFKVEETKCMFLGDPYHEFLITWE
jgi:hypothetical protein